MAENRLTLILENRVRGFVRGFKEASNATLGLQAASRNAKARIEGAFIDLDRKMETVASRFVTRMASMRTAILGLVAGGLVKKTTDFAGEFEKGLALVDTLLNDSSKSIGEYKAALIDLSRTTSGDLLDSVKAFYDIVGSGISTTKEGSKAIETLAAAQKAAASSTATTEEAANALLSVLNAYKDTGITAEEVTDKLFRTVDKGRISFANLSSVIGNVAGPAATFGVSLDDMLAATAALSRIIGPEESIVALNQVISKIARPTEDAATLFRDLGIDASASGLQINGLAGTLAKLKAATGGSAEALSKLFPEQRSFKGASILLGAQFENFQDFAKNSLPDSTGAVDAALAKMADSFDQQTKRIKNAFNDNLRVVGEAVIPRVLSLLKDLVEFLTANRDTVTGFFTGLLDAARGVGKFFIDIGPTIGVAVDALVVFAKVLGTIVSTLGPAFIALGPAIVAAWGIGAIIRGVQTLVTSLEAINVMRQGNIAVLAEEAALETATIERTKVAAIAAAQAEAAAVVKSEAEQVAAIEAKHAARLKDIETSRAASLTKAGLVPVGGAVPTTADTAAEIKKLEAKAAAVAATTKTQIDDGKALRESAKATAAAEIAAADRSVAKAKEAAAKKSLAARETRDVAIKAAKETAKEQAALAGLSLKPGHGVSPENAAKLKEIRKVRDAAIESAKDQAAIDIAAADKTVARRVAASEKKIASIRAEAAAAKTSATAQIASAQAIAVEEESLTAKRIADIKKIEAASASRVTKLEAKAAGDLAAAQATAATAGAAATSKTAGAIAAAEAEAAKSLLALQGSAAVGGAAAGTAVKTSFAQSMKGLGGVVKGAGKGLLGAIGVLALEAVSLVVSIFGGIPGLVLAVIGTAIYQSVSGTAKSLDDLRAEADATEARAAAAVRSQLASDTANAIARITGYKDFVDAVQAQQEKLFGTGLKGGGGGPGLGESLEQAKDLAAVENVRKETAARIYELEVNAADLAKQALADREAFNNVAVELLDVTRQWVEENAKGITKNPAILAALQARLDVLAKEALFTKQAADAQLGLAAQAENAANELKGSSEEQIALRLKDLDLLGQIQNGYTILVGRDKERLEALRNGQAVVTVEELKSIGTRSKATEAAVRATLKANEEVGKIQKDVAKESSDAAFDIYLAGLSAQLSAAEENAAQQDDIQRTILQTQLQRELDAIETTKQDKIESIVAAGNEAGWAAERVAAEVKKVSEGFDLAEKAAEAKAAFQELEIELRRIADIQSTLGDITERSEEAAFGIIEETNNARLALAKAGSEEEGEARVEQISIWYAKEVEAIEKAAALEMGLLQARGAGLDALQAHELSFIDTRAKLELAFGAKLITLDREIGKGRKKAFVDTIGAIRKLIEEITVARLNAIADGAKDRIQKLEAAGLENSKLRFDEERKALDAELIAKRFSLEIELQQTRDENKRKKASAAEVALVEVKGAQAKTLIEDENLRRRGALVVQERQGAIDAARAWAAAAATRQQAQTASFITGAQDRGIDVANEVAAANEAAAESVFKSDLERLEKAYQAELENVESISLLQIRSSREQQAAEEQAERARHNLEIAGIDTALAAATLGEDERRDLVQRRGVAELTFVQNIEDIRRRGEDDRHASRRTALQAEATAQEKIAAAFRKWVANIATLISQIVETISSAFESMKAAQETVDKSIADRRKAERTVANAEAKGRAAVEKAGSAHEVARQRRIAAEAQLQQARIKELQGGTGALVETRRAELEAAKIRETQTKKDVTEKRRASKEAIKSAKAEARTKVEEEAKAREAQAEAQPGLETFAPLAGTLTGAGVFGEGAVASAPLVAPIIAAVAKANEILRGAGDFVKGVAAQAGEILLALPESFLFFVQDGIPKIIDALIGNLDVLVGAAIEAAAKITLYFIVYGVPNIVTALVNGIQKAFFKNAGTLLGGGAGLGAAALLGLGTGGTAIAIIGGAAAGAALGKEIQRLLGHEGGIAGKMNNYREHFAGGGLVGASRRSGDTIPAMLRAGEGILTPEKGVPAIGGEQGVHMANNGVPPLAGNGVTQVSINANDAGVQALLAMLVRDVGISINSPFGTVRRAIRLNRGGGPPPMTQAVQRGVL